MKKIILVALAVLAILAWVAPSFAAATKETQLIRLEPLVYTIKKGDNLTKISKTFGKSVDELFEANKNNSSVKNRNLILKGGKLIIPGIYTKESVQKLSHAQNEIIRQLWRENKALVKSSQTNKKFFTLIAVALVVMLMALLSVMNGLSKAKRTLKFTSSAIESQYQTIKNLRKWQKNAIAELKKLNIQSDVKDQQVAALQEVKREAESLRNRLEYAYKTIEDKEKI